MEDLEDAAAVHGEQRLAEASARTKGRQPSRKRVLGPDLPAAGSVAGRAGWLARRRGLSEEEEVEEATLSEGGLA